MAGANADDDRNNRRIASQSTDSAADVPGKRGNEDASSLVEISCSICLELVVDDGSRSSAKLQCGHQFHLGLSLLLSYNQSFVCYPLMGQWLFANGSTRLFPEFVMEDWIPEEDLYALSYPEMGFVLVCSELQVLSLQIHPSNTCCVMGVQKQTRVSLLSSISLKSQQLSDGDFFISQRSDDGFSVSLVGLVVSVGLSSVSSDSRLYRSSDMKLFRRRELRRTRRIDLTTLVTRQLGKCEKLIRFGLDHLVTTVLPRANEGATSRIEDESVFLQDSIRHSGAAVGFKLDSLLKLSDTRAANSKMTLMHYLCKVLASKGSDLLDFHKDLGSLESASKIQLKSLAEEM
ncbi:BnaC05g15980D [Brassica napus]|uniref:BnaC05g15980D protein n=1 Tax=Brassica napus TaxID=3708 RepID=A0A078H225_BRANA|nr:BnaC05g15980D [Brassica napus]